MRLNEFRQSSIMMLDLVNALGRVFDMERVGGNSRVYDVSGRHGVIYLLNNSMRGLGLIWSKGTSRVQSVGVWDNIDFNRAPDYLCDIPEDATLDAVIEPLIKFIRKPTEGLVEGAILEAARNVSPDEFRKLARSFYGERARLLTLDDIKNIATHFDVHVPNIIRHDKSLRVDANHWNLFDDSVTDDAKQVGVKVGVGDPNDPHYQTAVELAKVRNLRDMSATGKIVLLGRRGDGELFEIPGIEEITAKIERMLAKELEAGSHVGSSMEEQYKELEDKVTLVAGGQSEFVKSLLITGMPSAGKTFRVMQTLGKLGLVKGKDYAVIGGKTTVAALYETLLERCDGLAIFDDCDSVVEDKNGRNILKKALDTDPVREVSYNAKRMFNTAVMSSDDRTKHVMAMSRIVRGVCTPDDVFLFDVYRGITPDRKNGGEEIHSYDDLYKRYLGHGYSEEDAHKEAAEDYEIYHPTPTLSESDIAEAQEWVKRNLPNTLDYQGRIIFISNMRADEWDSAILTRAFHVNMDFSDAEMFDYIETILQHIKTPRLTEEDKKEVLDYLRELWEQGKITRPVNFRLVQQAFDLRLMNGWRSLIASIG
jgi:hypothetical protein